MSGGTTVVVAVASILGALSLILALYLPDLLSPPLLSTPHNHHDLLVSAKAINVTGAFGPESLAFDPSGDGPYTGVADGRILKWDSASHSWVDFAFTSSHRDFMSATLNGDKTGRSMKYNKSTKQVTVLLRDIAIANGVALSKDRSFVLIAESRNCKILRYWLRGPNTGKVETFANLPGYPDNLRTNSKGEFSVALHAKKTPFASWLL